MTLHEAILKVLKNAGHPMSAKEIAGEINSKGLYVRKDRNPVPTSQINARVNNYPQIFFSENGLIHPVQSSILKEYGDNDFNSLSKPPYGYENALSEALNYLGSLDLNGDLNGYRKNLIYQIRVELEKDKRKTIGELNKEGVKIAVAVASIYNENRDSLFNISIRLRNRLVHNVAIKDKLEISIQENEIKGNLPPVLLNCIALYLATFKDFRGKDLLKFYFDLIEDWGMNWQNATPVWLSQLLAKLVNPRKNAKIWDPAMGTGQTLIEVLNKNSFIEVVGNEINHDVFKLASAFFYLENTKSFKLIEGDAFKNKSVLYDVVISDPPRGRFERLNQLGIKHAYSEGSAVFIEKMISSSVEGGIIACVVSDSLLTNKSNLKYREEILSKTWIKLIISLPNSSFEKYYNKSNSILILNKKKENEKTEPFPIRFIDGEKIISQIKVENPEIDEERIYKKLVYKISHLALETKIEDRTLGSDISYLDLPDSKILSVKYHLAECWNNLRVFKEKGEEIYSLAELLKKAKTYRTSDPEIIKELYIIQPKDLYKGKPLQSLITETPRIKSAIRQDKVTVLEESAIIINRRVDYLGPTYVKVGKNSIGLHENIIAFHCDEDFFLPEYIVYQLNSDLVKQQLNAMSEGGHYRYFLRSDFLGIQIPVPSISEQFNRIAEYKIQEQEKFRLVNFINDVKLVKDPEGIKNEIELFTKKYFPYSDQILFRTELQFEKFPFSSEDIELNRYISSSGDRLLKHLLIYGENHEIRGVITVSEENEISFEAYSEINAYANFLLKVNDFLNKTAIDENFERFSHTSKGFFSSVQTELDAIISSSNSELITFLQNSYIQSEEMILASVKDEGLSKEDFIAYNKLKNISSRVAGYSKFYLKTDESLKNILQGEIEEFNLIEVLNEIQKCEPFDFNYRAKNVTIRAKREAIKHSLTDLIQNARNYSSDRRCKVTLLIKGMTAELIIENKVQSEIHEEKYRGLGKKILTISGRNPSCGLYWAFRAVNDSHGEIELSDYKEHYEKEVFKIYVRFKSY